MNKKDSIVSDRLSREVGTKSTYNNLLESQGPLNKERKKYTRDIFKLALAFGYDNNSRLPLESKDNFLNKTNFGDALPSLINALAITKSDKGINILADASGEIYKVAEEYANGGLELLNSKYNDGDEEFIELLRLKILDLNENNRIIDKLDQLEL